MHQLSRGILIALEGIDGSGKSTVASNLFEYLHSHNYCSMLTREPGATELGWQLRTLVQERKYPMCSKAEFLLFAADRAQHIHERVIPALEEKKIVISDRMSDSSLAYQGWGRGLSVDELQAINRFAMNGITPDITLYIRVDPLTAYQRVQSRNQQLTSFEKETHDFMTRVVAGFDALAQTNNTYHTIDGTQTPAAVLSAAIAYVESWIQNKHLLQQP